MGTVEPHTDTLRVQPSCFLFKTLTTQKMCLDEKHDKKKYPLKDISSMVDVLPRVALNGRFTKNKAFILFLEFYYIEYFIRID